MGATAHLRGIARRLGSPALVCLGLLSPLLASSGAAQSRPTATRELALQAGAGLVLADSGSTRPTMRGYAVFLDADTHSPLGLEFALRQADAGGSIVYERTYEMGVRYHRHWRRTEPFVRAMYGRGVYNYPPYAPPFDQNEPRANLAYNLFALGGGADLPVHRNVSARLDLDWQRWLPGPYPDTVAGNPPCAFLCHGMQPVLVTASLVYRFPAGKPR